MNIDGSKLLSIIKNVTGQPVTDLKKSVRVYDTILCMKLAIASYWAEHKYCPYCGEKKQHEVSTDANSALICKNAICGVNEEKQ